jgi:hypothetical protein
MEPCCNQHAIINAKKVSVSPTRPYTGGAARARLLFTIVILQVLLVFMFGWSRSDQSAKGHLGRMVSIDDAMHATLFETCTVLHCATTKIC